MTSDQRMIPSLYLEQTFGVIHGALSYKEVINSYHTRIVSCMRAVLYNH